MKKRILAALLVFILVSLCSCAPSEAERGFEICFIDVGQGDAALVCCDGHYMLIDGGDKLHGKEVKSVLQSVKYNVKTLDILAISHMHNDHIGGLAKGLQGVDNIQMVITNSENRSGFSNELKGRIRKIVIPRPGKEYNLGRAKVKVLDIEKESGNNSLVLLITYEKVRFLFTGDIEKSGQDRVIKKLKENNQDPEGYVNVIKMPHHGAYTKSLDELLNTFNSTYYIISVGDQNRYNHPDDKTLELLETRLYRANDAWDEHVFQTNLDGNVTIKVCPNGFSLDIKKEK